MKILCTICARAGSKGVPSKNTRLIAGRPLIVHTIEQALACRRFNTIVVSTDSEEIASMARAARVAAPFLRPAELATDLAPKLAVLQHAARYFLDRGQWFDIVIDLDPTSP